MDPEKKKFYEAVKLTSRHRSAARSKISVSVPVRLESNLALTNGAKLASKEGRVREGELSLLLALRQKDMIIAEGFYENYHKNCIKNYVSVSGGG